MVRGIFIHLTAAMALWHATVGCCAHHDHASAHEVGVTHSHGVAGCCNGHPSVTGLKIDDGVASSFAACECRRDRGHSTCEEHDCRFPAPDRSGAIELVAGRDGSLVPPMLVATPNRSSCAATDRLLIEASAAEPPPPGEFALACRLHAALGVWRL